MCFSLKKVLVTGGAGFIGSHLVEELLSKGYQVTVLDRRVPLASDAKWIDGDLRWIGDCDRAVRGVDAVFHLAARISVDESLDYVHEYFNDNVFSTLNMMRAAQKQGVSRFIYTSSCEVYGDIMAGRASEEYPCRPTSPYAASKHAAESAVMALGRSYDLEVTVVRPFNAFGERQKAFRSGSVIPTFVVSVLQGKPILVHGDGSQIRDYLYVKDIVQAHIKTLEGNPPNRSIFNVASGTGISLRQVAEKISERMGKAEIRYVEDPRGEAQLRRSIGDPSKIESLLGWSQQWSFDKALDPVIDHYKSANLARY